MMKLRDTYISTLVVLLSYYRTTYIITYKKVFPMDVYYYAIFLYFKVKISVPRNERVT